MVKEVKWTKYLWLSLLSFWTMINTLIHLLFKPYKIRVFKGLEGVKMGGLPPICHP